MPCGLSLANTKQPNAIPINDSHCNDQIFSDVSMVTSINVMPTATTREMDTKAFRLFFMMLFFNLHLIYFLSQNDYLAITLFLLKPVFTG